MTAGAERSRPAAVRVAGLEYTYPDGQQALRGLDLEVAAGRRVALLGANGAGKTTLALALNGLHLPAAGTVHIGDLEVTRENLTEVRRRVGLVFQDPDDQLFMPTVREDVAFGPSNLEVSGSALEERVDAALGAVGVRALADRAPHHLSGGEKRRAALATVLAMRPAVLVLDEPTAGLDPAGRRGLVRVLRELPMTQIVVTHDLPFALELCPGAAILDSGRTVARGPTRDLLADGALLRRHGLELPFGLDPTAVPPASPAVGRPS